MMYAWKILCLASIVNGFFAIAVFLLGCTSGQDAVTDTAVIHEANGPKKEKAIVFVHGIFGNANSTWRNSDTDKTWPELLSTDKDFNDYSIYLVSYHTSLNHDSPNISKVAEEKLKELTAKGLFKYKQIYFIAHSMGGIVTRNMLVLLNYPDLQVLENLDKVRAVLSLSTPSKGTLSAEVAREIIGNSQLSAMAREELNTFLYGLNTQWKNLLAVRPGSHFPRSLCAYETTPTMGIMIVDEASATAGCDTSTSFPLNHEQISKPSSQSDELYMWVKDHVQNISSQPVQTGRVKALAKREWDGAAKGNLNVLSDLSEHGGEVGKDSLDNLSRVILPRITAGERITTLVIDVRPRAHYTEFALEIYLSELKRRSDHFKYVVFLKEGKYRGWMPAEMLLGLLHEGDGGYRTIKSINDGDFAQLERAGMDTHKIKANNDSWILEAPQMLEDAGRQYTALVDSQNSFIGMIDRKGVSEAIQHALTNSNRPE